MRRLYSTEMDFRGVGLLFLFIPLLEADSTCRDSPPYRCQICDAILNTCTPCEYDWYGPDCMFKCLCPGNCGDDGYGKVYFRREDGTCLEGCNIGWWGDTCNRTCNQQCERGCIQDNGNCIGDCSLGWWGLKCDKQCPDGCKNGCGCLNGKCLEGCQDGLSSNFCNESCSGRCEKCHQISAECFKCPDLLYGNNCTKECGANCVDYLCNMQGRCTKGCINGFRGSTCNETCPVNCSTCRQDDIICTKCKLGWNGSRCDNRDKEDELGPLDPSEDRTGQAPERREQGQAAACFGEASTPQHVTWTTLFANFVITWIILET